MMGFQRLLTIGRWVMVSLSVFFFVFALPDRIAPTGPPEWLQAVLLLAPAAVFAWFWARWVGTRDVVWPAVAVVAYVGLSVLAFALVPHAPLTSGGILVFAAMLIGAGFEWRVALAALAALLVVQTAVDLLQHIPHGAGQVISDLLNTAFVGVVTIGVRLLILAYLELMAARESIAQLAVAEERLRFARDLHDPLGQTLATVVLKSELVARRLPPDVVPELRQELQEVAQVARRSLDEVREAVAGYRQASVDRELVNALMVLRAAGITTTVDNRAGQMSAEEEGVFSWALREALTNVIKHSGARNCRITLARADGRVALEVADDGRGADGPVRLGNGLRGIEERALAAGGSSRVEADGRGFRTIVELQAG
jgi:two-component system, NarL family, sensor histidine kinase DesK